MSSDDGTPDDTSDLPWWEHAIAAFGAARKASQRSNAVAEQRKAQEHARAARAKKMTNDFGGAATPKREPRDPSCCIVNRKLK